MLVVHGPAWLLCGGTEQGGNKQEGRGGCIQAFTGDEAWRQWQQGLYRTVLSRSTLTGSGPASSLSSAGQMVTAMTGCREKGAGAARSSRYSLSPLMLSGWKRREGR